MSRACDRRQSLGEFEQIVLLAVLCAGTDDDAYGVNVHAELERRTKRRSRVAPCT